MYLEYAILTLSLRTTIRSPPSRVNLKSPWPLVDCPMQTKVTHQ